MSNFLEKLKKGMDIEKMPSLENISSTPKAEQIDFADFDKSSKKDDFEKPFEQDILSSKSEESEDTQTKTKTKTKTKKEKVKKSDVVKKKKDSTKKGGSIKIVKEKKSDFENKEPVSFENLTGEEGQLTIDLYETKKEIIIQSAVGGINSEDLDISIENDLVKIKGNRQKVFEKNDKNYFYQECYWGIFSREIILPIEVDIEKSKATIKNGILTIRMPKIEKIDKKRIDIKEEEE